MENPQHIQLLGWLVFAIASFTDIRERRIPNLLILAGLVLSFTIFLFVDGISLYEVLSRLGYGLAGWLILIVFAALGWMGHGDAKLLALLCFMLGAIPTLQTLLLACLLALPVALYVKHRRRTRGHEDSNTRSPRVLLPFAPFLAVSLTLNLAIDAVVRSRAA